MEKKAILFVRVSTDRQELDTQSEQLRQFALEDGYSPQNLIEIAEKESARKKVYDDEGNEIDRRGIHRMKQLVKSDPSITALYAWELSRLGRRQKVLMDLREFLCIDRKINIIIKTPSVIRLLDKNGEIDTGADMIFTFFAQVAESEMRQRLERFARTKQKNALMGKYNGGGKVMFGYKLDENNYYVVNEEEAAVVRLMFEKYCEGNSFRGVAKYLNKIGIPASEASVTHMMSNTAYIGEQSTTLRRKYPVIISKELWDKAAEQRKKNNKSVPKAKHIYYCQSLMRCPNCGRVMRGIAASAHYRCSGLFQKYNTVDDTTVRVYCNNSSTININAADSICWCLASGLLYPQFLTENRASRRKKIEKQLSEVREMKEALGKRYAENDDSVEKLSEHHILHRISDAKYESLLQRLADERSQIDADKVMLEEKERILKSSLNSITESAFISSQFTTFRQAQALTKQVTDDQTRYDIIHTVIKKITMRDYGAKGYGHRLLEFTAYDGRTYSCQYRLRAKPPKTLDFTREGRGSVARLDFEWIERFVRKSKK